MSRRRLWIGVGLAGAVIYLALWGATARAGVAEVEAWMLSSSRGRVEARATSWMPFVVNAALTSTGPDHSTGSGLYLWWPGSVKELRRDGPHHFFINTLF